tara:strand:+ start:573 stop:716 length:144 start_codon:yes stop_codon:yes gene_type:complete
LVVLSKNLHLAKRLVRKIVPTGFYKNAQQNEYVCGSFNLKVYGLDKI